MTIDDALNASTFEVGARALTGVLDDLDERYTAQVAERLGLLLADGSLHAAYPELANLAEELLLRLRDDGAAGMWKVTGLFFPLPVGVTPAVQGLRDALRLRYASPRWEALASLIAFHAEGEVADYALEVMVPALLEACSPGADDEYDDTMDAVEEARMVVHGLPSRSGAGSYAYYEVVAGDTLQDVAEAVLGSREAWPELVRVYRLVPPYILEKGSRDGVLTPGQRLMLPSGQAVAGRDGSKLGDTLQITIQKGLEVDLALNGDGDLVLERGLDGFASDLALRAMTPQGDLPDLPEYGLPVVAGLPANQAGLVRALSFTDGLYFDPRVGTVTPLAQAGTSAPRGVIVEDVYVTPRPDLTGE